jgi:hypothetical protein
MSRQSFQTFQIGARPAPRVSAAIGELGPVALTEPALAHVAAAGSPPGVSGGWDLPTRNRPK